MRIRKFDIYLNVDPGTMSPYQHGEVFVTEDGAETDLDLGHYERFTNHDHTRFDCTAMGRIYARIIEKERRGDYHGHNVQVVPHVIDEIKAFITHETSDMDFTLVEIGGTVGDIEGLPALESIRQLAFDLGREKTLFIHVALVPYIEAAGEIKTKAAQHSVRTLLSYGIQPDMLLCRTDRDLPQSAKEKLGLFCNVRPERVMTGKDLKSIYEVPLYYHQEGVDQQICSYFNLPATTPHLEPWKQIVEKFYQPKDAVDIAVVGKYVQLQDAYKSLYEALNHGGFANDVKVNLHPIDARNFEDYSSMADALSLCDGIIVPGGFGTHGSEGKIHAITYARETKRPFLGICFGMQLSVVEAARNLAGLKNASSTEFGPTDTPVIGLMTEWMSKDTLQKRHAHQDLGGTMRLGAYPCHIHPHSLAHAIYREAVISERHRHRYEVNTNYKDIIEATGLVFSGMSADGKLPEIVERPDHPFFIATQFHPELKSRPTAPHPLFKAFVKAALDRRQG